MGNKLIVRIEDRMLRIIQSKKKEKADNDVHINKCISFEFPDDQINNLKTNPKALADYIENSLKDSRLDSREDMKDITLLFGRDFGFFREYRFKNTGKKIADRRYYIEEDRQKEICGKPVIIKRLDYLGESDGMSITAVYGIADEFFRKLIKELNRKNVNIVFASSTLTVYGRSVKKFLESNAPSSDIFSNRQADRIIGLEIDKDSYKAAVFHKENLLRLEEACVPVEAGPEDSNLTDMLTDFLKKYGKQKEDTFVVVSGSECETEAKRLRNYSGIICKPITEFYEDELYKETFSITGLDPIKDKNKDENYLYGGWSAHKFSKATTRICIAAAIGLIFLFSILPAYSLFVNQRNETLTAEIERSGISAQLNLIYENRDTLSKLQGYKDDLESLDTAGRSSDVLALLYSEFLSDAVINNMLYDGESGLIIDFDITDESIYRNAKDKLNGRGDILIVETATGAAISGTDGQNVQIKVTVPSTKEEEL